MEQAVAGLERKRLKGGLVGVVELGDARDIMARKADAGLDREIIKRCELDPSRRSVSAA